MPNWHMKEKLIPLVLQYLVIMLIMGGLLKMLGNSHAKLLIRVSVTAVSALIIKMVSLNVEYVISPMPLGRRYYMPYTYGQKELAGIYGLML
jgi:hypothetical protein